jgi:hypothetical protein
MTKLTGLDLYILTETLLHSLAFRKSWTGSATEEARDGVLKKLQMIMNGMEVGLSAGGDDDFT